MDRLRIRHPRGLSRDPLTQENPMKPFYNVSLTLPRAREIARRMAPQQRAVVDRYMDSVRDRTKAVKAWQAFCLAVEMTVLSVDPDTVRLP